jgi:hypothetical protein
LTGKLQQATEKAFKAKIQIKLGSHIEINMSLIMDLTENSLKKTATSERFSRIWKIATFLQPAR